MLAGMANGRSPMNTEMRPASEVQALPPRLYDTHWPIVPAICAEANTVSASRSRVKAHGGRPVARGRLSGIMPVASTANGRQRSAVQESLYSERLSRFGMRLAASRSASAMVDKGLTGQRAGMLIALSDCA